MNKNRIIEKGEGPPLILLHGFMCSKEFFASQINYFAHYFKVVAYDLYGFGSCQATRAYSLEDYSDEFIELANSLGGKVNVIAHSFGCRVILKSAQKSNVINKAVLCGVAGLKPSFSLKKEIKKKVYRIVRPFFSKERLEKRFFSSDYNMLNAIMKESFKLVTSEYLDNCLNQINFPTFVIFGSEDRLTPPKIANKLIKNIPNCDKYIMNGCGHFCYSERPAEFNSIAKEFLI